MDIRPIQDDGYTGLRFTFKTKDLTANPYTVKQEHPEHWVVRGPGVCVPAPNVHAAITLAGDLWAAYRAGRESR